MNPNCRHRSKEEERGRNRNPDEVRENFVGENRNLRRVGEGPNLHAGGMKMREEP